MNLLFVCTPHRPHGPTAEQMFADWPRMEIALAGPGQEAGMPASSERPLVPGRHVPADPQGEGAAP